MKKILIVSKIQFGYLVDPFKYGQYLKEEFSITYLSWDFGLPKVELQGIQIKYISREGGKLKRYTRLLRYIHKEIKNGQYDIVFLVYLPGISFLRLANPYQKMIMDIRTASVLEKKITNLTLDYILKAESLFFKNITVISHGVAKRLGIKKYHLLPLGGETFSTREKSFENLHLLYVGTFENRKLIETVKGFHYLLQENSENPEIKSIKYTLVGDSPNGELQQVRDYILQNGLEDKIVTTGYIPNTLLSSFFDEANIGISFVPMTKYFDHQPPTKTFEYLLSGIPVIATKTTENSKLISEKNGVLIEDNAAGFKNGLKRIIEKKRYFNSLEIRENNANFHWKNIINTNLKPYLEKLLE